MHIFHNWERIKDTYEKTFYECKKCGKIKAVPYVSTYGTARPPRLPPVLCRCGNPIPPPTLLLKNSFWGEIRVYRKINQKCLRCGRSTEIIG